MKKTLLACLGVTIILVFVVIAGLWFWLFRELPVLEASLSLPPEVHRDAEVTMAITVTNTHDQPITLDSVDIDDSFLHGFQVVAIDPEPTDTMHVPLADQRSWGFARPVSPGESLALTFRLKAVMEGHFSGDIDVCNPNQDFKTVLADVVVRHAPFAGGNP